MAETKNNPCQPTLPRGRRDNVHTPADGRVDRSCVDALWSVSQDLLLVADLEGNLLEVNPAWTVVLGWTEAELLGRNADSFLDRDDQERARAEIRHLAAGGSTVRFEGRFHHRDGSYRWVSWKAASTQGRIFAMGRDVTELKAAEERLRVARRELIRVGRRTTLAATTASIAHEINQPLAAIAVNATASLRLLRSDPPDVAEVQAALEQIVHDSNRASGIIENVRHQFRKGGQAAPQPLNANELVRDVLALVRGELEGHSVAVQRDLPDDLPSIVGERVPLQHVLLNLIVNAIEAMSALTGRPRELSVKTERQEPDCIRISVADQGTGIDAPNMKRIFDAFFTTKPQGMGIGLSICQSIVGAHGGRLWAEPGVPHGSVFHVQLPIGA